MAYKLTEQDDWRAKYYEALRGFEVEGRQVRDQLQVVQGLVGRLCLAAQGQSPRLDQELKRLKDAVSRGLPAGELEPLGLAIAEAVRLMDSDAKPPPAKAPPPAAAPTVTIVSVAADPRPGSQPQLESTAGKLDAASALIRAEMTRLLDEVSRDPGLAPEAKQLEEELFSPMMGDQLPRLVEKVACLAVQCIKRLEKARQETEMLLGQMMTQLDSLSRYIAGHTDDESQRNTSSDTLNLQITGEMRAMGESVERGTDLEAMRRQLRERVEAIGHHLQSYRQREAERARQSRERTEDMRLRMDQMESEARRLQERLSSEKRLALLDPVTRIPNRLAWDHRFSAECERFKRFRQPICVAAWDIDHFKSVNDGFGHRAGDRVLAVVAETLAGSIRASDFVARYGGEEFAMLLPGTTLDDALKIADKVRLAVADIGFHFRGKPVQVTISGGITEMRTDDAGENVFERADKALYDAKERGRNCVVRA
ncbi:MAG TPA: diguanylate cyclase [Steroidobacteraceae bacterium]|nr:diguanylate cyclase [Steroidobacteraceae bacterium]